MNDLTFVVAEENNIPMLEGLYNVNGDAYHGSGETHMFRLVDDVDIQEGDIIVFGYEPGYTMMGCAKRIVRFKGVDAGLVETLIAAVRDTILGEVRSFHQINEDDMSYLQRVTADTMHIYAKLNIDRINVSEDDDSGLGLNQ